MKRLLPLMCAAALALTATGATLAPAYAQSFGFQINSGNSDNDQRRGFERRGNDGYYNGQRGSRTERPGYRYSNGFWFPMPWTMTTAVRADIRNPSFENTL